MTSQPTISSSPAPSLSLFPSIPEVPSGYFNAVFSNPENASVLKQFFKFAGLVAIMPFISLYGCNILLLRWGYEKYNALLGSCIVGLCTVVFFSFFYVFIVYKEEMKIFKKKEEDDLNLIHKKKTDNFQTTEFASPKSSSPFNPFKNPEKTSSSDDVLESMEDSQGILRQRVSLARRSMSPPAHFDSIEEKYSSSPMRKSTDKESSLNATPNSLLDVNIDENDFIKNGNIANDITGTYQNGLNSPYQASLHESLKRSSYVSSISHPTNRSRSIQSTHSQRKSVENNMKYPILYQDSEGENDHTNTNHLSESSGEESPDKTTQQFDSQ